MSVKIKIITLLIVTMCSLKIGSYVNYLYVLFQLMMLTWYKWIFIVLAY